jgi:hypothetical protein
MPEARHSMLFSDASRRRRRMRRCQIAQFARRISTRAKCRAPPGYDGSDVPGQPRLVTMPVMRVGPMRMGVGTGVVLVRVGMGFRRHHVVAVIMMAVIVRMRVVVAHLFVGML